MRKLNHTLYILLIICFSYTIISCKLFENEDSEVEKDKYLGHTVTASKIIDQTGGTLTDPSTKVSIQIPQNALTKPTTIEIGTVRNLPEDEELSVSSTGYHFGPDSLVFNKPVLITIPYDPNDIPIDLREQTLQIHHYDKYNYSWSTAGDSVNTSKHEAYGRLKHFSYYAVRGNIEPKPVELFKPEKITYNSIKLNWSKSEDADFWSYDIYMSETPDVSDESNLLDTFTKRNNNEIIVKNLKPDTEYYFKVYVHDRQELNIASNEASFNTEALNPLLPVELSVYEQVYPEYCWIEWTRSQIQNFQKYSLRYSLTPGVDINSLIWPETNPYFTDPIDSFFELHNLPEGATYYLRVYVHDMDGNSIGSNELEITTPFWSDMPGIIPDSYLERYIRWALNYHDGELTSDILSTLETLDWAISVYFLKGIEHCTNLEYLDVRGRVKDISFIKDLIKLYHIYFQDNQIEDLNALADMVDLEYLNLNNNNIEDISPLANLINLTTLQMYWNKISDISSLANLINITELILYHNNIEQIGSLSNLNKLAKLHISDNNITDISVFENSSFTDLTTLVLSNNNISDIGPLVRNQDFGENDMIYLDGNPLNSESINTHIPELQSRGVNIWY